MAASDDIKLFLQSVITTDEGWFCLLITPSPNKDPEEWYKWPEDYDKIVQRVHDLQDQNVYFSPHLFSDSKSLKANVLPTRTIVADLDNADVTDLALNPTILLETSPGRHQGFWILRDPIDKEDLELLSKKLSYTIEDCDRSGWPLGHRFRVPGARNFKYDPPATVRLITSISTERIYDVDELETITRDTDIEASAIAQEDEWIQEPPTTHPTGPREALEKYRSALGAKALSYFSSRQADRSEALWALMMALFRAGATREEVYWISKHSANNKFDDNRYANDRDLAKDVVRAQNEIKTNRGDVRSIVALAQKTEGTANDRKRMVTRIVTSDMLQKGEFIATDDGRYWYLHANAGRPIQLGKRSEQLDALLDTIYDLNASDGFQPYVTNHLLSYTVSKGRRAATAVLSAVQDDTLILHGGKADVYRITKDSVTRHNDGQFGVLFPWRSGGEEQIVPGSPLDEDDWASWVFEGWFENLLDLTPEQATALIRVWVLFILFRDNAVSRPILALLGQPGSGKSTLFRMIYTIFYGKLKSLNAVSTPDDFDFLVASDPLAVFDNVDSWNNWLPDRLALSASSSDLVKRKLYTDNDTITVKRQAILGITAHDPRFGRADVVDRMIILNFSRRNNFIPESQLMDRVYQNRSRVWGSIIQDVQKVLAEPEPSYNEIPSFRISDFARVGTRIAKALGIYKEFRETIVLLRQTQTAFSLSEEDVLVDVIKRWHNSRNGKTPPGFKSVGSLWETFDTLEPTFQKSYKSGQILARRLWTTQANLKSVFDVEFRYDNTRGIRLWRIDPPEEKTDG